MLLLKASFKTRAKQLVISLVLSDLIIEFYILMLDGFCLSCKLLFLTMEGHFPVFPLFKYISHGVFSCWKSWKYNFSLLSLSGQDNQDAMDLFGGADDISSGSDGEDKPPTPGQPIVSVFYNLCRECICGIDAYDPLYFQCQDLMWNLRIPS